MLSRDFPEGKNIEEFNWAFGIAKEKINVLRSRQHSTALTFVCATNSLQSSACPLASEGK